MNIAELFQFFMSIDEALVSVVQTYGIGVYFLLFLVIFIETGLVIMPFLPGDSLIFAAGALAAVGSLNVYLLFLLLTCAAILGDSVNYWIGKSIGMKLVSYKYKKDIIKTEAFYAKHGGKTIIIARFIPFIRTFAPFVAGVGKMNYFRFFLFNVIGGVLWTALFLSAGYFFGNIPIVKDNFSMVILGIIFLSILPAIIEIARSKLKRR